MKFNFRIRKVDVSNESWYSPECFPGGFIEIVDMKCLDCDYEEEMEADIIFEYFNPNKNDFPSFYCPHCNTGNFVPKDVYDQIKGNFIYKPIKSSK